MGKPSPKPLTSLRRRHRAAAMLRRYIRVLGAACYFRRNTELEDGSVSSACFSSIQTDAFSSECKRLSVRIVLAGGLVELYQRAVTAAEVMERHPGMCVARPEVFRRPDESILEPKEVLLPGQKFYLVPITTVMKLKQRNSGTLQVAAKVESVASGTGVDESDEFCSAKDFYNFNDKWTKWITGRYRKPDTTFTPPIRKAKMLKTLGWKPSLDSVEETSP